VWDERDGTLPNNDVEYPALAQAAAFVCGIRTALRRSFAGKASRLESEKRDTLKKNEMRQVRERGSH